MRPRRPSLANMLRVASIFCCFALLCLMSACGKKAEAPRTATFFEVGTPAKISDLTLPALVRDSKGDFFTTLFVHSTFPSATDAAPAITVLKSSDDGATWQEVGQIPSHVTYGVWGYDLAIDKNDILYMTWTASHYRSDFPSPFKVILFSRSDDGGLSWSAPVPVSTSETGQRSNPAIAVSGKAVHIAWLDAEGRGTTGPQTISEVYIASSHDGGITWDENLSLEKDLNNKISSSGTPSLCVDENGAVYCAYFSLRQDREGGFWIAKSTDEGRSFAMESHTEDALGNLCLTSHSGKLFLAAVHIKSIRSISMQDPQTYQEIRFHSSSDGGQTWTKAVLIDDDLDDRHKSNIQLVAAVPERLIACWHDERGGVYMAASLDGGKTWGKNLRIANASRVGITPLDLVANDSSGTFYLMMSDVRHGRGDATFFLKGMLDKSVQ